MDRPRQILVGRGENGRHRSSAMEAPAKFPKEIVIVGGGAAGFAGAEKLQREHY